MPRRLMGVGVTGPKLTDLEKKMLDEATPYGIVLFGRNIESADQLRELVRDIKSRGDEPPLIMVDQEGGRVDRLRNLVPGLPAAELFGVSGDPERLAYEAGKTIGAALRWFGIDVNFAPVVDIRHEPEAKGLESRCFGSDHVTVTRLAGEFIRGHHEAGVASCLKHYPGLGRGRDDTHYGPTFINASLEEIAADDIQPYLALGEAAKSVMICHGSFPGIDPRGLPATLSNTIATHLLRETIGFTGVAFSDDMEMHAVSDLGPMEEMAERAIVAGCDVVLYCSQIERVPDMMKTLNERAYAEKHIGARFDEAASRASAFRAHCASLAAGSPAPESLEEVLARASALAERIADRRSAPRDSQGTGRTGREEWT